MSSNEYNIAAEADTSSKANRRIWLYFILLGIGLYLTIIGLDIMYRFSVQYEKTDKIGLVNTEESIAYKAEQEAYLSGKKGLFDDKSHIPISQAMSQLVSDIEKGGKR